MMVGSSRRGAEPVAYPKRGVVIHARRSAYRASYSTTTSDEAPGDGGVTLESRESLGLLELVEQLRELGGLVIAEQRAKPFVVSNRHLP